MELVNDSTSFLPKIFKNLKVKHLLASLVSLFTETKTNSLKMSLWPSFAAKKQCY